MLYGGIAVKIRPNLVNFIYLVGSGLIIQLIGTIYRIWLARAIGAEGLGIMQMIYPVYRLLSGVASLGLPMVLTKWVAEYLASHEYEKIESLKRWAFKVTIFSSLATGTLLFLCTPVLGKYVFTDPRVKEALFIVTLAIPFSALSSIYRGYFQGHSKMAPTAVSEITEQVIEISVTLIFLSLASVLLQFSTYTIPIIGLTMGEVTCWLTLRIFLKTRHAGAPETSGNTSEFNISRYKIFRYAWPLLINQIVTSVSMASEGIIIPRLLINSGLSAHAGTELFGKLTGMAEPVAYFPLIFLVPLGSVLSPQISYAVKAKNFNRVHKKVSLYYLVSVLICIVCFFTILFVAAPLSQFFYNDSSPVNLIRLMVIGLPFTGIAILNIAIMAATGATDKILWLSIWAMGLKTFLLIVLIPATGIKGAAWAINSTQIFIALASLREVKQIWSKRNA